MYFAEVEILKANESREFIINHNGEEWLEAFSPDYLDVSTIYSKVPLKGINFSIERTGRSTLPPILNALEIYEVNEFSQSQTNEKDGKLSKSRSEIIIYMMHDYFNILYSCQSNSNFRTHDS